ncbi:hypothetical protein mumin63_gp061 [Flavobacterium phage vB_FspS_mumin6-3]|uniref:Uncharacterized protein n=1 Tax=Flavobacterium phage vB_FspS_mumin6-3 TaxID=2686261 RepID=A0A6B9LCK8_9CAUD|nr:hypothetical protein mumin63_gp061 [Flavobacterium phage vB_FspS_mumin6-3]
MANLINSNLDETENLLSVNSLLRNSPTINFDSSSMSSNYEITDELQINSNALSFKATLVQNVITNLSSNFDFGDALEFTAKINGVHSFSFYLLQGDINANLPYNVDVKLKVYINDTLIETDTINVDLANGNPFQRLSQSFYVNKDEVVNFKFRVEKDSVGNPNPNIELFFTGFQANYGNVNDYNIPYGGFKEYQGTWDYANTLTAQSFVDTAIYLENNGLGAFTNKTYKISGIEDIFDTSSNQFDFSLLDLGDRVDVRLDLSITTTSSNQSVKASIELGIGDTPYEVSFLDRDYKAIGTYNITISNWIYIGNEMTKDMPAKVKFFSDDNATILVNGWAVNVIKKK